MIAQLDQLIDGADAILVGNFYKDTISQLETATTTRTVLDLTRMNRDMVSQGKYQGICW